MSELTEREYLALSAVVDVEGGLLRFDMVGDIPEDVFLTLQKAKLITPRLGGYRATRPGLLVLREYRATAAAQGEVCRCGYPMADHDANGECPGDGYLGDDDDEPLELSVHRFIPGLWRVTHVDGVASMELVAEDATDPKAELQKLIDKGLSIDAIKLYRKMYDSDLNTARDAVLAMKYNKPSYAELEAALQQAQRERDAAVALVNKAHKVLQDVERWLPTTENFDLGEKHYSEVHSAWKAGTWIRNYWLHLSEQMDAASAQQAAQPADGEG